MQEIALEKQPNQAFTLILNSRTYRIRIADATEGLMVADITLDTLPLVQAVRCLHGDFIIPFDSMTDNNGNFFWFDDQGREPHWENFGVTCRLYYIPQGDIDAIKERRP